MDKKSVWDSAYSLAFGDKATKKLQEREIYNEAISAGLDKTQAGLLARLESFVLASVGAMSQESQNNLAAVMLQQQNSLNERTGFLAREVGRLHQQLRQGSVGTALWNGVAGSVIGQRLGLQPINTPAAPAPVNLVPKASDPHADTSNPPEIALSSTLQTAGFTFEIDETVSQSDRSGCIIVKNSSGSDYNTSAGVDLITITYHKAYAERPIVTAYVESNASGANAGYLGPLQPKVGGTTTGVTLQSINVSSGDLLEDATFKIRYFVQEAMPSS